MSRRLVTVRASAVRAGDVVKLERVSFLVQRVLKGRGRLSFITDAGFPVDIEPYSVVSVLR